MSGGVDSTVAVRLLLNDGFSVAGATMRLQSDADTEIAAAENAAAELGIPFSVFELTPGVPQQGDRAVYGGLSLRRNTQSLHIL